MSAPGVRKASAIPFTMSSLPTSPANGQPSEAQPETQQAKPERRFDQLPIGLNQREPIFSVKFQGQDGDPGAALWKFLEFGDCGYDRGNGRLDEEKARYCVDLNKGLGPKANEYGWVFHKCEWPGYEHEGFAMCHLWDITTRCELGKEIAVDWVGYLRQCAQILKPETDLFEPNPVVDGIEFKRIYLSEFYATDWREWEAKL
ncbi:hypothetical protein EVJ58_g1041 [Rhodofomes roseus]|uniref:Uncharacterized protein n=1 Tax=Rhodofomes roseus TaxID=34475 RepID=A0A4Y9Z301_9APHY|nr:hypothetical protein EVJ58_g1041 [Rhodofomes roseus]